MVLSAIPDSPEGLPMFSLSLFHFVVSELTSPVRIRICRDRGRLMLKWAESTEVEPERNAEMSLLAAQLLLQRCLTVGRKPFVELILTGATFAERAVEAIERLLMLIRGASGGSRGDSGILRTVVFDHIRGCRWLRRTTRPRVEQR
jgi:hypothetical protein